MRKIVLVYGLIAGAIVGGMMVISLATYLRSGNYHGSMVLGYATMLIAFSLIFVGVKNYRDKHNNGVVSFGKAFRIGLYIALIASTIYVAVWLIEYYFFVPDFMDKYVDYMMKSAKDSGATQAALDKQMKEMSGYQQMYKNPLMVILFTYAEILPVGLVVSLISALILKRKVRSDVQVA